MVNKDICAKCEHAITHNHAIFETKCSLIGLEIWPNGYTRNAILGLPPEDCPYRLEQLLTMPKVNVEDMLKTPSKEEPTDTQDWK